MSARVLHVLSDSNIGGAGAWVAAYVAAHDAAAFDITVALPSGSRLAGRLAGLPCEVRELQIAPDVSYDRAAIPMLRACMREIKPDIVHTHGSLSGRIAAKRGKLPVVFTKHTLSPRRSGIKRIVYGMLDNRYCDRAIAVSRAAAENLREVGLRGDKIRVVYNGAAKPAYAAGRAAARASLGLPDGAFTCAIVARLETVKRHEVFLEAARIIIAHHGDARFLIVGGGSRDAELHGLADSMGIAASVTFTGELTDIGRVYAASDALALTSESENLPMSLCEAMAAGVPAVASAVGGVPEVVEHGVSGLLFPRGDAKACAEALLGLMQDRVLYERVAHGGIERWAERFTPERCAEETEKVYTELLRLV